jgi:hypothetical protein
MMHYEPSGIRIKPLEQLKREMLYKARIKRALDYAAAKKGQK